MPRLAILLFCALLAVSGGLAAPAPLPRPSQVWNTGWDRPVDPVGDCRFERQGDKLTITVPGKGHELDVRQGRLDAPHLLRQAEGDFLVQVRVGVTAAAGRAGLLLRGGDTDPVVTVQFAVTGRRRCNVLAVVSRKGGGPTLRVGTYEGPPVGVPAWLRLERRGRVGKVAFSEDGKKWVSLNVPLEIALPQKVKVGVVAEAATEATFDQFQLTPRRERSTR
jgi:regulation of enolase protein 1 (concanavalin A-like superfamily)